MRPVKIAIQIGRSLGTLSTIVEAGPPSSIDMERPSQREFRVVC